MGFSYLRNRRADGTLNKTWLIQRLNVPFNTGNALLDANTFAFGGGLVNGGLSKDAMNLLRPIFSFDYMGAAEFEFGAVPEALNVIARAADKGKLVAHSFEFDKSQIQKDWSKDAKQPTGTATIYVLCVKGDEEEIESRITKWASERYNGDLKETTNLAQVLDTGHKHHDLFRTRGWLELSNGFMFFADYDMFKATANLFGVKVD